MDSMRVFVVVHIYYENLWPELEKALDMLSAPFDLQVTCIRNKAKVADMVHEHFPAAKVELVDNRGFDMGPFFHVLNNVCLDDYDVVVKLHTKRDIPQHYVMRINVEGTKFRERLLAFAKSEETWKKALRILFQQRVGMVGDGGLVLNRFADSLRVYDGVEAAMRRMGLSFRGVFFVAGSMFIVRASLLKPFQGRFHMEDFEIPDRSKGDCLPHFLERALGYAVYAQGYRLASWDGRHFLLSVCWWRIRRALFHVHHGKHHDIFRVCGIPVWYRRTDND